MDFFIFYFQPTRLIVHLVPEPVEVTAIHSVAQLQVDDHQDPCCYVADSSSCTVFLRHARIHREENVQCLDMAFILFS